MPIIFKPESFEAANPFLAGAQAGQQMFSEGQQQQLRAQQLQQALLANQLKRAEQPYQIPADIAKYQAISQYLGPQTAADLKKSQLENQYYGRNIESQISQRQIENQLNQFKLKNPLLSLTGPASQIGAISYIQQHPELFPNQQSNFSPISNQSLPGSSINQQSQLNQQNIPRMNTSTSAQNYTDLIRNTIGSTQAKNLAIANLYGERATGLNYLSLPVGDKQTLLAYAAGMAVPADEAAKWFLSGKSLEQLAQSKGLNLSEVTPIYNPQPAALRQMQIRQGGVAEINTIADKVNNWIAPYSRTFMGYSPDQIMDALKGENKSAQAKYWAGRALTPELSAMRMRVLNGQVGIESIREISNITYGNLRALPVIRDPEVFEESQRLIDKTINEAFDSATKAILRPYKEVPKIKQEKKSVNKNWVFDSKTGKLIPEQGNM